MYASVDNVKVNGESGIIDAYSGVFIPGSGGNGNSYTEKGNRNKDGDSNDFINCDTCTNHSLKKNLWYQCFIICNLLYHNQMKWEVIDLSEQLEGKGIVPYTSMGSKLYTLDITGKNESAEE